MIYKALLAGNDKVIINEFFEYMESSFECMSTSARYEDIMNHLKCMQPDVFVFCLSEEKQEDVDSFAEVGRYLADRLIPVVVIGVSEECSKIEKAVSNLSATVLKKPISTKSIELSIVSMLKETAEPSAKTTVGKGIFDSGDILKDEEALFSLLNNGKEKKEVKKTAAAIPQPAPKPRMPVQQMPSQANPASVTGERKHILVVDDDSSVLKLIKGYLSAEYDVATAISGKVALKFLEVKKTDLVLLDYEMPMENGPGILSKIRENKKTKDLPVIFLTGVTESSKIKEVLELKPQGYLLKPIDMPRLSAAIKNILG